MKNRCHFISIFLLFFFLPETGRTQKTPIQPKDSKVSLERTILFEGELEVREGAKGIELRAGALPQKPDVEVQEEPNRGHLSIRAAKTEEVIHHSQHLRTLASFALFSGTDGILIIDRFEKEKKKILVKGRLKIRTEIVDSISAIGEVDRDGRLVLRAERLALAAKLHEGRPRNIELYVFLYGKTGFILEFPRETVLPKPSGKKDLLKSKKGQHHPEGHVSKKDDGVHQDPKRSSKNQR